MYGQRDLREFKPQLLRNDAFRAEACWLLAKIQIIQQHTDQIWCITGILGQG